MVSQLGATGCWRWMDQKTPKEDIPLPISSNTLEPLNSLGGHAPQHPRVDQDTVWEPELKEVLCARSKFHNET